MINYICTSDMCNKGEVKKKSGNASKASVVLCSPRGGRCKVVDVLIVNLNSF